MKIGLISLGCPKNLVDSEVMLGLARQGGHELTHDPASAEVLVVNTCAFIDSAKKESIDAILEMAQHKKDGSCTRLIVTGCLAERYRDELRAEIPEIDAVLGTGEVPDIVKAISGVPHTGAAPLMFFRGPQHSTGSPDDLAGSIQHVRGSIEHPRRFSEHPAGPVDHRAGSFGRPRPNYIYDADTPRVFATPRHYAYVKIAEGCDYKCAFCIIPTLRGAYRSRTAGSIVKEARDLAARGIKELLLISQDTTFYGIDRNERGALARLLRALNDVDGLEWIRLLYLYPTTIDDETLAAMADCQKICKYIDLPLQHASDPVLKRMQRPGTRKTYDRLLTRIRGRVPGVALRTTFIVGFPGETDTDVDELCGFIQDHAFDHVGVFTYSHEEGTAAHRLTDDVPAARKMARLRRVMGLQRRLIRSKNRSRIGERTRIVVDGPAPDHELVLRGRLATQAPDIDAVVYLTECDPSAYQLGDFAEVEIVGARDYDLLARPVV
jgi:ribosomal protein S12 methylthiotransferase